MLTTRFYALMLGFAPMPVFAQYQGTGSVTRGPATTTMTNLYSCQGGRVTNVGTITSTDKKVWTVPAATNFTNSAFPVAPDLNNPCTGKNYASEAEALAALSGKDIVNVDSSGEVITAFVFADNYFEMYINGKPVGKDAVPYTQFNSSIVRFRVKRPFTIAMLLVDWEENLGLGSENNSGLSYYNGDGGMVAVFRDSLKRVVAITSDKWKAQTFYTAPVTDLTCPSEKGSLRLSDKCSTKGSNNGTSNYALHWERPANWMMQDYDDSGWPDATTFTNATVGVDNKPSYTNFVNIFDNPAQDAQFIWSTNLILDNEILVRYKVGSATGTSDQDGTGNIRLFPNPAMGKIHFSFEGPVSPTDVKRMAMYDLCGNQVMLHNGPVEEIGVEGLKPGIYFVRIETASGSFVQRVMVR